MASAAFNIEIRVRWWVIPYLRTLLFVAWMTASMPDPDRVVRFIMRHGVVVRIPGRTFSIWHWYRR